MPETSLTRLSTNGCGQSKVLALSMVRILNQKRFVRFCLMKIESLYEKSLRRKPRNCFAVERDAEARAGGNFQEAIGVEGEWLLDDVFDVGDAGLVFDPAGDGERGRESEVGGDADGGVPAVGNEQNA